MIDVAAAVLPWILIAALLVNMAQRRHQEVGVRKRYTTLYLSMGILGSWCVTIVLQRLNAGNPWVALALIPLLVTSLALRRRFTEFRRNCTECGERADLHAIVFDDTNRCRDCRERSADEVPIG